MTIGCWAKALPASMTLVAAIAIIAKRNLLRMFPPNLLDCSLSRPVIRLVSSLFCSHFRPSFKLTLPRLDKRHPRAPCRNLRLRGDCGRLCPPSCGEQAVLEEQFWKKRAGETPAVRSPLSRGLPLRHP